MILAIDQGSSKTAVALVSPDGPILSTAISGGACYFAVGVETAFAAINQAVEEARESIDPQPITRIFGGLAGANWPDELEMLTREFRDRYGVQDVTVRNDCVVALRGGSGKPNCIVLCAGSAGNSAVMAGGQLQQVLNNFVLSPDQGGSALGTRALNAVFESHAGIRPETKLTKRLLDFYGCDSVERLLVSRDHDKLDYTPKEVVNVLLDVAYDNDPVALQVIYEFSKSMARYATGSLEKYGLVGKDCDIVLSGGVFKSSNPLFMETIATEVHRVSQQATVVNAKYEPIVGAALLGLEEAGADEATLARCRESARSFGLTREKDAYAPKR